MFYFVIGFIVFISAIIVGTSVYKASRFLRERQNDSNVPPTAPQPGWVRRLQDSRLNAGWRIQMIPYDDANKPMMVDTNVIALAGAAAFLLGMFLMVRPQNHSFDTGKELVVGGLFLGLFGVWFKARNKRAGWEVTTARCVDRELRKAWVPTKHGGHWGWFWRMVCEYDHQGAHYRVTPEVYWLNFNSEAAAQEYLAAHVSPDGECALHINPRNPLQTELKGEGIKEPLLYNRQAGFIIILIALAGLTFVIWRHTVDRESAATAWTAKNAAAPAIGSGSEPLFVGGRTTMQVKTNMVLKIYGNNGAVSVVQFTALTEETAAYRWRSRPPASSEVSTGTGTLREYYDGAIGSNLVHPRAGNDTTVKAGNLQLAWSGGGDTFGWLYFATNLAHIEVLDQEAFDRDP